MEYLNEEIELKLEMVFTCIFLIMKIVLFYDFRSIICIWIFFQILSHPKTVLFPFSIHSHLIQSSAKRTYQFFKHIYCLHTIPFIYYTIIQFNQPLLESIHHRRLLLPHEILRPRAISGTRRGTQCQHRKTILFRHPR